MPVRKKLLSRFVPSAVVVFALLLMPEGTGSSRLLAATCDCGGYNGPKCSETTSCAWYLFGKICTTNYTYYPGRSGPGKGDQTPEESDKPIACRPGIPFCF